MNALLIILSILLIFVILYQLGKLTELAGVIRGEKDNALRKNDRTANSLMIFMVLFLVFCFACSWYFRNDMLAYGPNVAASIHGVAIDGLFNWTLFFTGIVFVVTQIALFYFSWKYRAKEGHVAEFISHDNKLEVIWTLIPAVVMAYLVVSGLIVWAEKDSHSPISEK